jgi:hypothetical protein
MTTDDDEDVNGDAAEGGGGIPPRNRCRLRLNTLDRVRVELVKIYREGRDGRRDVGDASKLAHILTMIARILEGSDLEKRIEALEAAARQER